MRLHASLHTVETSTVRTWKWILTFPQQVDGWLVFWRGKLESCPSTTQIFRYSWRERCVHTHTVRRDWRLVHTHSRQRRAVIASGFGCTRAVRLPVRMLAHWVKFTILRIVVMMLPSFQFVLIHLLFYCVHFAYLSRLVLVKSSDVLFSFFLFFIAFRIPAFTKSNIFISAADVAKLLRDLKPFKPPGPGGIPNTARDLYRPQARLQEIAELRPIIRPVNYMVDRPV